MAAGTRNTGITEIQTPGPRTKQANSLASKKGETQSSSQQLWGNYHRKQGNERHTTQPHAAAAKAAVEVLKWEWSLGQQSHWDSSTTLQEAMSSGIVEIILSVWRGIKENDGGGESNQGAL
jgi:hypothetical protein